MPDTIQPLFSALTVRSYGSNRVVHLSECFPIRIIRRAPYNYLLATWSSSIPMDLSRQLIPPAKIGELMGLSTRQPLGINNAAGGPKISYGSSLIPWTISPMDTRTTTQP